MNFNVLILDGELVSADLNLLICWVFDHNTLGDTFSDWTGQLNILHLSIVLHCHLEVVELVFTTIWLCECSSELVDTLSQGQEVQFVLFVSLSSYIKGLGSADEQALTVLTLDLPFSVKSGSLLALILDSNDEVMLLLGIQSLSDGAFTLRLSGDSLQFVEKGSTIWQWEEETSLVRYWSSFI